MKNYIELVRRILDTGETRVDRTGTGTLAVFGGSLEFDLRERFPLVTIKETRYRVAFLEMLWFLRGEAHTDYLRQHGSKLWDAWANDRGNLGPVYGVQWRAWCGDQIRDLIEGLVRNPTGRRHIVSAWNVGELYSMALPPCHRDFQCYVSNNGYLDMMVAQRSWDVALGAPFNIAQYALLLTLLCRATGLKARTLRFNFGDAHLYMDHVEPMRQLIEQGRVHNDNAQLLISTNNTDIDGYIPGHFSVTGYEHGRFLKLAVSV
jgi:thymidylate synthase